MSSESKLSVSACLFIEGSGDTFLKFTVFVRNVTTIESKVVKMNHQFKIFRDMSFRPVLSTAVILKIVQTDLINTEKGQSNILQPSLSLTKGSNSATLLDSLRSKENRVANKGWMTSENRTQQEVALVQCISVGAKHVDVE